MSRERGLYVLATLKHFFDRWFLRKRPRLEYKDNLGHRLHTKHALSATRLRCTWSAILFGVVYVLPNLPSCTKRFTTRDRRETPHLHWLPLTRCQNDHATPSQPYRRSNRIIWSIPADHRPTRLRFATRALEPVPCAGHRVFGSSQRRRDELRRCERS